MTYPEHVSTEILADHAEGLLGESESGRVDGHLAECEDCRATALLLASIPAILAADEVGPMPAVYASRIDAAIADLLVSEPPVPLGEPVAAATPIAVSPIGHDPATNNVVDLASRRKVALTGLRRVSTVAAGMVLLIAGAALGIQTVGKDRNFGDTPDSVAQQTIQPSARTIGTMPIAPKYATKGPNGSMIDPKTGAVYTKSGKVLYPDGSVILPPKTKGGSPTLLTPGRPKAEPAATAAPKPTTDSKPVTDSKPEQPSKTGPLTTAKNGNQTATGDRGTAKDTPTEDPAAPGAQQPTTTPDEKPITAQKVQSGAQASDDPYVSESGSEYNEDNFAALVMDLVAAADRHSEGSSSFEPSSTSPTPTPSMKMPSGFRMPSSWASFFAAQQMPQQPGRGPAEARFQNRVERCAAQIGYKDKAIAGDIGTWQGKQATIVVVPSPNESQVDGYVFYGGCPNDKPVTAESAQWTQRVDRPAPDSSEPTPTPVRRTGSIQPAAMDNASRTAATDIEGHPSG